MQCVHIMIELRYSSVIPEIFKRLVPMEYYIYRKQLLPLIMTSSL